MQIVPPKYAPIKSVYIHRVIATTNAVTKGLLLPVLCFLVVERENTNKNSTHRQSEFSHIELATATAFKFVDVYTDKNEPLKYREI